MPLIIMTGVPSSGKTKRTQELKKYFQDLGKDVHVVSEIEEMKKAGFNVNTYYNNSQQEKHIRATIKSEVIRLTGPTNLVILDASNYIKGYRYELYCATKVNNSTQCLIECMINYEIAFENNLKRENEEDKYTREVFDALCLRYECPNSKNRWDSPLFVVQHDEELDFKAISECLFEKKPPPPNMSTQNPPLSNTNFLYELDKITNDVTQQLIMAKKLNRREVKIPGYPNISVNISNASIAELNMIRRQYINYSKMHTPTIDNIVPLYIQYLKTNLMD